LPNKRIAVELDIVEQTVKVHRGRIMDKLAAESVADVVRLVDRAVALGIAIEPKFNEPMSNIDPG
jgi:FixJ family two-component response regulator